jgi:hypothetical protein
MRPHVVGGTNPNPLAGISITIHNVLDGKVIGSSVQNVFRKQDSRR